MGINLVVEEKEAPEKIPEDVYQADLIQIEEGTGIHGDYVRFIFEIREGDYAGIQQNLLASKKLTKSSSGKTSKLYEVVKALSKESLEKGANVNLDDLIGKSCKIIVKDGKEKDGYQTITTVMPS